jgi:hypothetical protein
MSDYYRREDFDPNRETTKQSGASAQPYNAMPSYEPKPPIASMVVLAIINMLCCAFGVGFILGLVALVFALIASNEQPVAAREKLKIAKIINIVGIVLAAIQMLLIILGILFFMIIGRADYSHFEYGYPENNYPFENELPFEEEFDIFDDGFELP